MKVWDEYTAGLEGATGTDRGLLRDLAHGVVLDVGCGIGGHLDDLPLATRRLGLDPGLVGLLRARATLPSVDFVCASGYEIPLRADSVDAVILVDTIEHVAEPGRLLREAARVLRGGGALFVQTPNYPAKRLYDLWHVVRRSRDRFADDPTHVSKFNARALERCVRDAGFTSVSVIARNLPSVGAIAWNMKARTSPALLPMAQKVIVIAQKPRS